MQRQWRKILFLGMVWKESSRDYHNFAVFLFHFLHLLIIVVSRPTSAHLDYYVGDLPSPTSPCTEWFCPLRFRYMTIHPTLLTTRPWGFLCAGVPFLLRRVKRIKEESRIGALRRRQLTSPIGRRLLYSWGPLEPVGLLSFNQIMCSNLVLFFP